MAEAVNHQSPCKWYNIGSTKSSIWVKSAGKTFLPSVSLASCSRSPPNICNKKYIMLTGKNTNYTISLLLVIIWLQEVRSIKKKVPKHCI